jgi:hypothetical protein
MRRIIPSRLVNTRAHCVLACCLFAGACSHKDNNMMPSGFTGFAGFGASGANGAATAGTAGLRAGVSGTGAFGTSGTGFAGFGAGGANAGAGGASAISTGAASVLQYHNDPARDGVYIDPLFTRLAAGAIKKDPTFVAAIKGPTYAQPLYYDAPDGRDLVITATEQNEVSAFSALDGSVIWQKVIAPPGEPGCGGSIRPLGITGTPVIDPETKTLYVAAMTMGMKHQVFALSLLDGSVLPGWPVDVGTVKAGATAFNPATQNQRGALLLLNKTLYVPYGGNFQDCGDYHGWVVGIPVDNPAAPLAYATKGYGGGIWAPGGLASDGVSVFAATGNTMMGPGMINTSPASWSGGNAVLRLSPTLADIPETQTTDFFAAQDWKMQDMAGTDLGSSGPALFSMLGATPGDYVLAFGKNGGAYLLNRANLGGMGMGMQMKMISSGGIAGGMIQAAAVYKTPTATYAAFRSAQDVMGCKQGTEGNFGVLKLTGSPPTMAVDWCADGTGTGSPIVTSTDGMQESVVWLFSGGRLFGFDGETGATLYAGMESVGTIDKYQTPIVAKGRLFIAATGTVYAFTVK